VPRLLAAFLEDPKDVPGRIAEGRICQPLALRRGWHDDLAAGLGDLLRIASTSSTLT
jgi:hypothetical protein